MKNFRRYVLIITWVFFAISIYFHASENGISDNLLINIIYLLAFFGAGIGLFILSMIVLNRWGEPSLATAIVMVIVVSVVIGTANFYFLSPFFREIFS